MGSLPIGVHDVFHKLAPLASVRHQSVQGASRPIFLAPVHQIICPYLFRSSLLFFPSVLPLRTCFSTSSLSDSHRAYMAEEVRSFLKFSAQVFSNYICKLKLAFAVCRLASDASYFQFQFSLLADVLATSTGSRDGLMNVDGGACYHHNMKLVIIVCCPQSSK